MNSVGITAILTPQAHQRMINRYSRELNPATPELNKPLLRKIEWHTRELLEKTGELPQMDASETAR